VLLEDLNTLLDKDPRMARSKSRCMSTFPIVLSCDILGCTVSLESIYSLIGDFGKSQNKCR
jgi:hypothetical protein